MATLISSSIWVRRGVAAQFPQRYDLDDQELERVTRMAGSRLEQVKEDLAQAQLEEEKVDVEEMIAGESDEEELEVKPKEGTKKDTERSDEDDWTELSAERFECLTIILNWVGWWDSLTEGFLVI